MGMPLPAHHRAHNSAISLPALCTPLPRASEPVNPSPACAALASSPSCWDPGERCGQAPRGGAWWLPGPVWSQPRAVPFSDSWRRVTPRALLATRAVAAGEAGPIQATARGGPPRAWLKGAPGRARSLFLSSWAGLGTSRQLSGPGGTRSGMPSLSSSSSHSSPIPSLSVSSWALLMTVGQLSVLSWCPSPSLQEKGVRV